MCTPPTGTATFWRMSGWPKDATVFKTAYPGPCIIGHRTEVNQCALSGAARWLATTLRGGQLTELKNVILFDNVQVPHYNYVGFHPWL